MKKISLFLILCTLVYIFQIPSLACWGFRPMGMGGAYVAVADDANLAYWNRAGAGQLDNWKDGDKEIVVTDTVWNRRGWLNRTPRLGNTYYDSFNFAQKINKNFGWSMAGEWSGGSAVVFSPSIGFRLPWEWADKMSVGIGYFYYKAEQESGGVPYDYTANQIQVDYLWRFHPEWSFGVHMENFWNFSSSYTFPQIPGYVIYNEGSFIKDVNFRPGIAWMPKGNLEGLVVNAGIYNMFRAWNMGPLYSGGFEYTPPKGFWSSSSFRAGWYNYTPEHDYDFLTLGYGLKLNKDVEIGYWGAFESEPFFNRAYQQNIGVAWKF
ncbi:MAG: hypothetical protein NT099_03540 [Candidatus Saganbacteria bacterium]|nr:hypothetical protein [Candidatus Saganbacteria bacterium]